MTTQRLSHLRTCNFLWAGAGGQSYSCHQPRQALVATFRHTFMSQTVAVGPGHQESGKTVSREDKRGKEEFRPSKRLFFTNLRDAIGSQAKFLC